jgi:hemolysin III
VPRDQASDEMGRSRNVRTTPAGECPGDIRWDYDRIELIADAIVHALGVGLGVIGAIVLVIVVARSTEWASTASVLVYAAGLVIMLGCSAAYNMWPVTPIKWLLRRFDHSAIYVLIAATYTPFLAHVKASAASIGLLAGVWAVAIFGIVLKLSFPGRFDRLSIVLYLLLGWAGAAAYPVVAGLPHSTLWLIAAGGVLYSVGVIFHLWESLRFQNATWHGFVVLAAACHYTAVLDCVTA